MSSSATPRSTVASSAIPLRTPSTEMITGTSLNQDSRPRLLLNPQLLSNPSHFRDTNQFASPTSASTSSAYSPISESPTSEYHYPSSTAYSQYHHHQQQQQQQHHPHYLNQYHSHSSSSSLPADSFPRTLSKSIAPEKERFNYEQLSRASLSTHAPQRSHYQLHRQLSYPPTSSSDCEKLSTFKDISIHSSEDKRTHIDRESEASSFSNIGSALPEYSYPMSSSQRVYQTPYRLPYSEIRNSGDRGYSQSSYTRNSQEYPNDARYRHPERHQPESLAPSQNSRPSIYTTWNSHSLSARNIDNRVFPTTPRSMPTNRPLVSEVHTLAESPVDFRESSNFQHSTQVKPVCRDGEIMSYSEDIMHSHSLHGEDPYEESDSFQTKKQKKGQYEIISSRGKLPAKGKKALLQKRITHRASHAHDQLDDEVNGIPQSSAGKGVLRFYAQRVCNYVEAKGSTSNNELVYELFGIGNGGDSLPEGPDHPTTQENIRRRVYDALNVLEAAGIIAYSANKDIHWVGMGESGVSSSPQESQFVSPNHLPGGGKDDESEEPEDDDMDIEKLQKEIRDLKLQNEREVIQLEVQNIRHAQITNLVNRNKRRENEREERRKRKEERRRARAIDEDSSMVDVGPQLSSDQNEETNSNTEGTRRRRESRGVAEKGEGKENMSGDDEPEDEDARTRRKREHKERRKLKAQRKLEKENNKIPLPFIVMKMPRYVGHSSDSESNISVIRQVCKRPPIQSESSLQEKTTVNIHIPQEDPIVMSDTEILEDLGF